MMQAELETRMRELSADGGGVIDLEGGTVVLTHPPLTIESRIFLKNATFELHLEKPGTGADYEVTLMLPDVTTSPGDQAVISLADPHSLTVEIGDQP